MAKYVKQQTIGPANHLRRNFGSGHRWHIALQRFMTHIMSMIN